jgi:hypothetical protein
MNAKRTSVNCHSLPASVETAITQGIERVSAEKKNSFGVGYMNWSSLFVVLSLATGQTAFSSECGSKEGYLNQLASSILIPSTFPPDNEALRNLVSDADLRRCERIRTVNLNEACLRHDSCYEMRLPKSSCDETLQDEWIKACRTAYSGLSTNHLICQYACTSFVKLMSEAQRFQGEGFCPSCDAYDSQPIGE